MMSTIKNHKSVGFQPDKFGDILQEIKWDRDTLKDFVNSRINALFQRRYAKKQIITFNDIFCEKVGQVETFSYLLSKTLMRPRELLDLINKCLEASAGKNEVTPTIIRKSEVGYSQDRLIAIANEWQDYYPTIDIIIGCLKGMRKNQSFEEFLNGSRLDKIIESVVDSGKFNGSVIELSINRYLNVDNTINEKKMVAKNIIDMLYRVGIMGVKPQSNISMQWSDKEFYRLEAQDFGDNFRIQINDIFDIGLNVR